MCARRLAWCAASPAAAVPSSLFPTAVAARWRRRSVVGRDDGRAARRRGRGRGRRRARAGGGVGACISAHRCPAPALLLLLLLLLLRRRVGRLLLVRLRPRFQFGLLLLLREATRPVVNGRGIPLLGRARRARAGRRALDVIGREAVDLWLEGARRHLPPLGRLLPLLGPLLALLLVGNVARVHRQRARRDFCRDTITVHTVVYA